MSRNEVNRTEVGHMAIVRAKVLVSACLLGHRVRYDGQGVRVSGEAQAAEADEFLRSLDRRNS